MSPGETDTVARALAAEWPRSTRLAPIDAHLRAHDLVSYLDAGRRDPHHLAHLRTRVAVAVSLAAVDADRHAVLA